jgi:hypothetical protein
LAGFDDLIEVTDRAFSYGAGERSVDPFGVTAA